MLVSSWEVLSANDAQCNAIHRTIKDQFKQAIVYGRSVKHQPQRVGLAHELADEDIGACLSSLCKSKTVEFWS